MSNTLKFNQCANLLSAIHAQATGKAELAVVDTTSFVTVANAVMQTGYDNAISAVSTVLSKTIFSIRPYNRKFKDMNVSEQQFGAYVRKLHVLDGDAQHDHRQLLADGTAIDQQKVVKPRVLQTNFVGGNVYQRQLTIFKDQMDTAFRSPEEFGMFINMIVQNVVDLMEKDHEEMARLCLANFCGGKYKGDSKNVVHLLTEYNNACGTQFTVEQIKHPDNYGAFLMWAIARIRTISDLFTERTRLFHINIDGKEVSKHTPYEKQRLYIHSGDANEMYSRVLPTVFNDEHLKKLKFEKVSFWQSVTDPGTIKIKPVYMLPSGELSNESEPVTIEHLFGVLFDEEAMGYTVINQWSAPAPFNASGGYANTFWHYTDRYWNDFMENAVLFVLD